MLRFRLLNLVACVILVIFNAVLGIWPMVAMNVALGIGEIFGGLEMIRHPLDPLGMKTELIAASPFDTYSWPGSYCWFLLA